MTLPSFDQWQPYSIDRVSSILHSVDWILAGGYAIEQYVGHAFRPHGDIDILLHRKDQQRLYECFDQDQIWVNDSPGHLSPVQPEDFFESPVYSFWICTKDRISWCLQVMLIDVIDGKWIYKRKPSIQMNHMDIFYKQNAIRILKPEIQLLYKSKGLRPKDQLDFDQVLPLLSLDARNWLKNTLRNCYDQHPWIERL